MGKIYNIFLDKQLIGTTALEKADAPMGVVFGDVIFLNIISGYSFFKDYCSKNKVGFDDFPDVKLISTRGIPNLKIFDNLGVEIKGMAASISGMDSDVYELTIEGVPYPFFGDEFPQHVKAYNDMLNDRARRMGI